MSHYAIKRTRRHAQAQTYLRNRLPFDLLVFSRFFFFSSRRRHTRSDRDWSSDVCSSDLFTKRDKTFTAGLRVYDISKPAAPREIGFMAVDGLGLHRLWYVGGRYAYASCHWQGFTDHVLAIIDLQDPTKPEVVGRFWLPGMNTGAGETPSWSGKRYALHHPIVVGNLAYTAWRDGGFAILDVADPTAPKLLSHRNWSPPFGGGSHTPLPLPGRGLAVIADEGNLDDCANGIQRCWVFDVREPTNPVSISTCPTPSEIDYCRKGAKFGPHNLQRTGPVLVQIMRAELGALAAVNDLR